MDYITCNQKRNKPKVSIAVCAKCKRRRNCADYRNYLQPLLFPDLFKERKITKLIYRRDVRNKRMQSEVGEILDRPEQLTLNL
jgi:hypothetical protein